MISNDKLRSMGRVGLAGGSVGLIVGAVIAYFHHDRAGQAIMFVGAVLLVIGTVLLANTNPPAGGSNAG